jgi:hypothetical protein
MKSRRSSLIAQYLIELNIFRSFFLLSILTCSTLISSTQTTISGIVNTYYPAIEIVPAKACVRVTNPTGLNHNDKVMIIQMKGAGINTSNTSLFGDTTSLNNAGNYEIATVCHVDSDSVFLVFMLLNQYTVTGKVQLVKIPHYVSALVTDTLKPAPWNNATGTGGVLAISVEEDLLLNEPIYADSSCFRGGDYRLTGGDCTNFFPATGYVYNANINLPGTQDGAFKGEGIADVVATQSGGRGAPANGGGGGNNHNNGGAGGANLSSGGDGGGNSSSAGCRIAIQGKGGKALSNYGGLKIFGGGGGGAGHSNYNLPNARGGGHGGGIVFIQATNLVGNNKEIVANGQTGGNSLGDGGSGGGAGGTIILDIMSYTGVVTIEAKGGNGGTANDGGNVGRCYGGGGGGSGGAIYFSGAVPAITSTANGGNAGPETGRDGSCNPAVPSFAGSAGLISSNYIFRSSQVLESSYCALLLPVELIWFRVIYKNDRAHLSWKIAQPETAGQFIVERSGDGYNWTEISIVKANEQVSLYRDIDPLPQPHSNFYRLKMIDKNKLINYSTVQSIFITPRNEQIHVYPNPAKKKVFIMGNLNIATEISLFDLSGKLLLRKKIHSNQRSLEIVLPDLSAGIYVIKVGDIIKRLIIH